MNFCLIFAGGVGKRMRSNDVPKQFLTVFGKPIIIHTLEKFESSNEIDGIVISCVAGYSELLQSYLQQFGITKVIGIVNGGATGQDSIFNGLSELRRISMNPDNDIVLVHDGVRPLIDGELISRNISTAKEKGDCITVCPVSETIVQIDGQGKIATISARECCRFARAPQTFVLEKLMNAHLRALTDGKHNFIDSASLYSYYGGDLYTTECFPTNIKITTQLDFVMFRELLEEEEDLQLNKESKKLNDHI